MCTVVVLTIIYIVGGIIVFEIWKKRREFIKSQKEKLSELAKTRKRLYAELEENKRKNAEAEKDANKEVHLYEIIKDITKTLDDIEMFRIFKKKLGQYIRFEDCIFIDSSQFPAFEKIEYYFFPLRVENNIEGYLGIKGCKEDDLDVFHILANQFSLGMRRIKLYKAIEEVAIRDELAGTYVRKYVLDRFFESLIRASKYNMPLGFLMIDIDNFKKCNDIYGHLVGDAVLKEVANRIKGAAREIDLVGRYGGEEFCVILIDTDKEGEYRAGERVCQAISSKPVMAYNDTINVTVSIGAASFPEDGKDPYTIIEAADRALYSAKSTGKNKVVLFAK